MKPASTDLKALARRDPALGRAMDLVPAFPGFPDPSRGIDGPFHALARAIIYQQLATGAASAIHARVRALGTGEAFPAPLRLLELPEDRLAAAGLSRSKRRALRDLALQVTEGGLDLEALADLPDDEVVERLTRVWGIGVWTAQMHLIFTLGRLDVMPAGDLGVREGVRRLDGLESRPTPGQVLQRADVWRPLRSVASWVLWRLTDAPPADLAGR